MKKILIANRGEIAVRVIHAAKELGYPTVAIYSDPDAQALHVKLADESFSLQGSEASETYLDIPKILNIARQAKVWGIHPGYGFLSENAAFAQACEEAGIKFIGPTAEAMRLLGSKVESKKLAEQAKVPTVPGYQGKMLEGKELQKTAEKIGYPLLIKAAAGGGGKGMRVVHAEGELESSIQSAQREALAFFKDETIFFEKYIEQPRHIEVQILGDESGNIVHLFERECSVQRRHQKMIEESPSPSISSKLRKEICEAALRLAKKGKYRSAGTFEFIVDPKDHFYFLEANTRLQVEHPVTEWVTGIDLVKAQIMIAEGHDLPIQQEAIFQRGHSIECRLYAEDPENEFLPAAGTVGVLREPQRPGVRIDSALQEGHPILSLYDPMLAKLIVYGSNRKEALQKMDALLRDYVLLGTKHNLDFLRYTLNSKPFQDGRYHTHTVAELMGGYLELRKAENVPSIVYGIAMLAGGGSRGARPSAPTDMIEDHLTPQLQGFKNA